MKLCSPQFGISPLSNLGGAVHDREILKRLARLGVEIEIPLPKGELYEDVAGWHVYSTPRHIRYYYEYNWLFLPRLLKLWRRPGFDLLRIHSPTLGPLGWLFKKVTGVPTVANYHHWEGNRIIHVINRVVIPSYDLITTVSHFAAAQFVSMYGLARDKVVVVHNGVDDKYQPRPKREDLRHALELEGKTTLLYLGVLTPRKNLLFLLDVLALVLEQEPNLVLMIGGTGPQENELKAYAQCKGLQQAVVFTGYISEADKVDYYNLADVFVFPSLLEGFGMAVAEAMACGVPVVSSNAASLPEVIGQAGLLASPTCIQDFGEQVIRLVRDDALRRQLGEAGRTHVRENFSWEKAARLTFECYQRVARR